MSLYTTVITTQEEIIQAYSKMLHVLLSELSQHRNVEAEENHLKNLDKKGGLIDG